jgi:hypothetical protein
MPLWRNGLVMRPAACSALQGLHPRADTLLQVTDDAVGHFDVNVLAVHAVGVRNLCLGHFPISFKWAL